MAAIFITWINIQSKHRNCHHSSKINHANDQSDVLLTPGQVRSDVGGCDVGHPLRMPGQSVWMNHRGQNENERGVRKIRCEERVKRAEDRVRKKEAGASSIPGKSFPLPILKSIREGWAGTGKGLDPKYDHTVDYICRCKSCLCPNIRTIKMPLFVGS